MRIIYRNLEEDTLKNKAVDYDPETGLISYYHSHDHYVTQIINESGLCANSASFFLNGVKSQGITWEEMYMMNNPYSGIQGVPFVSKGDRSFSVYNFYNPWGSGGGNVAEEIVEIPQAGLDLNLANFGSLSDYLGYRFRWLQTSSDMDYFPTAGNNLKLSFETQATFDTYIVYNIDEANPAYLGYSAADINRKVYLEVNDAVSGDFETFDDNFTQKRWLFYITILMNESTAIDFDFVGMERNNDLATAFHASIENNVIKVLRNSNFEDTGIRIFLVDENRNLVNDIT